MNIDILQTLKYAAGIMIVWCIVMTPAYLARQSGRNKHDMMRVRVASWLFGWSGLGWFFALILGAKK